MNCGRAAGAVSDLTYIPVGANFAYLYVIMDAFSRKIVGWSLQKTMHAQGALNALKMALSARKDISQPLIHHRSGDPVRSRCAILLVDLCSAFTASQRH
ncbi:DDE-type integrase/transposase/recombinase [Spirosoma endophyticum]|uniref:Integrase core domain-containing protein n=1 Tax=Spirosoma endophyticum TaxID=662367 RepID=A0A1I2E5J7_9BACT|nr:Integrase core domain-containing protein [Spirosoma endophyticum]